jgi:hypothetical protein
MRGDAVAANARTRHARDKPGHDELTQEDKRRRLGTLARRSGSLAAEPLNSADA